MTTPINIVWFRQDLRLSDNPALVAAAQGGKVLPIYVLDDENSKSASMGAARAAGGYITHSLHWIKSLKGKLCVFAGDATSILQRLTHEHAVESVHWNRCYEPWRIQARQGD